MTKEYKIAIFDMDGTLIDSTPYWRLGAIEYLLSRHLPVPDNVLNGVFYRTSLASLAMAMKELHLDYDADEAWSEMTRRMRIHYANDVEGKPFAQDFLRMLTEKGVRCCVATAAPKEYAIEILDRLGFTPYLEHVYDNVEIGMKKESPAYFLRLAGLLGAAVDECMLFEDALYSIRSAREAGMRVTAIAEPCMRMDQTAIRELAERFVQDYRELL